MEPHSGGNWITIYAANCRNDGLARRFCSVCGDCEDMILAKDSNAHVWGWVITEKATCASTGTQIERCSICAMVSGNTQTIPATGAHTSVKDPFTVKAATCTSDGKESDTVCSVCGETVTIGKTIPATGHSWGEWKTDTFSNCTMEGEQSRSCVVCDATEERSLEKLAHKYSAVVVAPTANEKGYTRYTGSVCGDTYVDSYTDALSEVLESIVFDADEQPIEYDIAVISTDPEEDGPAVVVISAQAKAGDNVSAFELHLTSELIATLMESSIDTSIFTCEGAELTFPIALFESETILRIAESYGAIDKFIFTVIPAWETDEGETVCRVNIEIIVGEERMDITEALEDWITIGENGEIVIAEPEAIEWA